MQFIDAVEKFKLYLMQTDKSKETMSGYEKDLKNLHMFLEKNIKLYGLFRRNLNRRFRSIYPLSERMWTINKYTSSKPT